MANINMVPEFTQDEVSAGNGSIEEVKETTADEEVVDERETQSEPPAEIKPVEPKKVDQDTGVSEEELKTSIQGLLNERINLLKEIVELRGTKREIKQQELQVVEKQLDDLKDLHPEDVTLIDRVLRVKGFVTKDEANKMFYKSVQDEELNKFLEKYPEYRPENDPSDQNWLSLQKELAWYKMPENPHLIVNILERAHRAIATIKISGDRSVSVKKKQIQTASVGGGGTQRSSSVKSLDPHKRSLLEQGGWSEEEIKKIEQQLQD